MKHRHIEIGIGIGEIIFGMTQDEVIQILGQPDNIESSTYLDAASRIMLSYEDEGIELSFDSEDEFKLISIDIENSKYNISNEKSPIGMSLNKILENCERQSYSTPSIDSISNEFEPNHLMLYYDNEGLMISLIDYVCDSFSINPLWKNEEEMIWPERSPKT